MVFEKGDFFFLRKKLYFLLTLKALKYQNEIQFN